MRPAVEIQGMGERYNPAAIQAIQERPYDEVITHFPKTGLAPGAHESHCSH